MKENKTCTDCVREDCHGCDITNKSRIDGVTRGLNLRDEYEKGHHFTKTDEMINAAKELDNEKEEYISKYANTPINPKHYNDPGSDVIKFCMDNNLDFMQGNIVKYIVRYKQKNGLEDLKKTAEYLRRLIEREESKSKSVDIPHFALTIPEGMNVEEYKKKIDGLLKEAKCIPVTSMNDIQIQYS